MATCAGCGEEIVSGKILTALGKKWHPQCFKCDECGNPITGGSFSIREDMPICSSCANKLTGGGGDDDDDGPTGKDCGKCGEPLTGAAVQGLTGGYWHPECFTCFDCGDVIDGSKGFIKDKDGQPLHGSCAKNRGMGGAVAGETCGKCGKELLGSCVTAMDQSFHKECFVCASCGGSISKGFMVVDDKPYCKDCHKAGKTTPSEDNSNVITTSGTKVVEIPAENTKWMTEKDDGVSSAMAREANKQANKSGGTYKPDYNYKTNEPKPKAKKKPAAKPVSKPKAKANAKATVPAFCGECGTKHSGGRFCGECGFKFF